MIYTLMHFDAPLIVFSAERQAETNIRIIEVHKESKELFPLDLAEISERGIESWIKHRSIPKKPRLCRYSALLLGVERKPSFGFDKCIKGA